MTPANPDALADAPYVLLKRGLFERPGHHGYTGVLRHAGRFSHEEASSSAVHGGSVTMMLASEAPAYSPACWHETQVEDLLDLLRIERGAKAAAEARAAQLQAEVGALKGALEHVKAWIDTDLPAGTSRAGIVHRAITKALDRTALAARAATAREGQADA
ncbi:hypothetical protein [Methylorubrum extorquens]|uniref:Uncharacterized protein n=1 Tax=Methylorubrum extorquens DSM 13060 TaxID=882800 RepID=H1KKN9_METEX|nr:hypothetical protein [Methylorubrum extorquens]EHP91890.1 hypothetical protein MetexDRAFT_3201 [Methylorubrum extorquens DSM 13060]